VEQIDYGWKQNDAETRKIVPVHTARKTYGGTGGTVPIILNLITRVGFMTQPLYPQANSLCTHQIGGWG
jgi:purine-cytosine permease-like protein